MAACLISVGSNLGDKAANLRDAAQCIGNLPQISLLKQSRHWKTLPIGGPETQSPFLNEALLLDAKNSPLELLQSLQQIELDLGRTRDAHWGPRPIDLDILLFGDEIIREANLCVPHPRMAFRRFALEPATEIAPEMIHPELGLSVEQLLEYLDNVPPYVAIAGPLGAGKTHLAKNILSRLPECRCLWEKVEADVLAPFYANPTFHGPKVEIQFLERRVALLESLNFDQPPAPGVTISDFWFDQSAAFAQLWLSPEQYQEYEHHYLALRARVPRARVLVMLDLAVEQLVERIAARGRPYEQGLRGEQLERLQHLLDELAHTAHRGPILRLDASDGDRIADEVHAAIEAMTHRGVPVG